MRPVASGSQVLVVRAAMCSLPLTTGVSPRDVGRRRRSGRGLGQRPVVRAFVADVPGEILAASPVI